MDKLPKLLPLSVRCFFFIDGIAIIIPANKGVVPQSIAQQAILALESWAKKYNFTINLTKTMATLFSLKKG
jgi:sulfur relay (sulfurtransferase) complex TusBCD TusD component (DsrE family)